MSDYEESQLSPISNWLLTTTEELSSNTAAVTEDDDAGSDYSLDYEYLGPRRPNYRDEEDADSDASDLTCTSWEDGFDMWDEDPYSTNEFTWESNDMKLTNFMKARKRELDINNSTTPWNNSTFWRKQKGWPKQLPGSNSTTNHDQSAGSMSLVLSDYGSTETLHAVYKDRIIECGKIHKKSQSINQHTKLNSVETNNQNVTTWLESDGIYNDLVEKNNNSSAQKYLETHASISMPHKSQQQYNDTSSYTSLNTTTSSVHKQNITSKFIPYTKYIQRSNFPVVSPQDSYISLGFEPLCIAEKYGYMAIGGVEGEFELYCCMDQNKPTKIWGTKFKGKNNVMLMTNAVQIVRWRKPNSENYKYLLLASMNDAGLLIYNLPTHRECHSVPSSASGNLYCHIRNFDHVPINDARVSPDGEHLICIGDGACIFYLTVSFDDQEQLLFSTPIKYAIPSSVLPCSNDSTSDEQMFSSQYGAWSRSSLFFAQTSDSHYDVLVWRTKPTLELLYRIDAGGYTYAIQFHPEHEGILAFSNRYGYVHTVNLEEAVSKEEPGQVTRILDYDRQTMNKDGHKCTKWCQSGKEAVCHTFHLLVRHEITMVSFRGEKDRRLRILAKINGLQWSQDGSYLYVSTKKRVLAYQFLKSSSQVKSLKRLASLKSLSMLEEKEEQDNKRKRGESASVNGRKRLKIWHEKWEEIPTHIRNTVLDNTYSLASHW